MLEEAARKIWEFKQENPSVNAGGVSARWTSLLVQSIGQIVALFGLEGAGYLVDLAKQLLGGSDWVVSLAEVAMLQLALSTSSNELCAELVRIATVRSQQSNQATNITESQQSNPMMHSAQSQMHSAQSQLQSPDVEASFDFLSDSLMRKRRACPYKVRMCMTTEATCTNNA